MKVTVFLVCVFLCALVTSCKDLSDEEIELQNTKEMKFEIDTMKIRATGDDDGNPDNDDEDENV